MLGGPPREEPAYLAEVGFLAQEIPLYRRLTAEDHIGIGAHLNPRWDGESVRERLASLKIPLDRPAGTLSGGQRAQLALALTLAKRPRVLLLDEPLAALDPLARQNFLAALAEAAAGGDLTIVLSSHLIADAERTCDHLILLAESQVQLCGDTETLLAQHRILTGPRKDTTAIARAHAIVREDTSQGREIQGQPEQDAERQRGGARGRDHPGHGGHRPQHRQRPAPQDNDGDAGQQRDEQPHLLLMDPRPGHHREHDGPSGGQHDGGQPLALRNLSGKPPPGQAPPAPSAGRSLVTQQR